MAKDEHYFVLPVRLGYRIAQLGKGHQPWQPFSGKGGWMICGDRGPRDGSRTKGSQISGQSVAYAAASAAWISAGYDDEQLIHMQHDRGKEVTRRLVLPK